MIFFFAIFLTALICLTIFIVIPQLVESLSKIFEILFLVNLFQLRYEGLKIHHRDFITLQSAEDRRNRYEIKISKRLLSIS